MRLRSIGYAGAICAIVLAGIGGAVTQERRSTTKTTVRTEERTRASAVEVRRISAVVGGHFALAGGEDFGKIEDIVINDRGCIDYVIIVHENHFYPIPWSAVEVDFGQKVVSVEITREHLLEAPSFTAWAEFSKTDWRDKVTRHYESHRERRTNVKGDRDERGRDDRKDDRGKTDERRDPPNTKKDGRVDSSEKGGRDAKPAPKKSDEKKSDEKKSDEKKSDEKKPDEKKGDEKKDKPSL